MSHENVCYDSSKKKTAMIILCYKNYAIKNKYKFLCIETRA